MHAGVNHCISILGNILNGLDGAVKLLIGRERLI
jgi:hypothetical protein